MEIKAGMKVFFLNRCCYNPNDVESLVVECAVSNDNGRLRAKATKKDEYTDFHIDGLAKQVPLEQYLFLTREAGLEAYNKVLDEQIAKLMGKSKQELLETFFRRWAGENILDTREFTAMQDKIKQEFGVEVS